MTELSEVFEKGDKETVTDVANVVSVPAAPAP